MKTGTSIKPAASLDASLLARKGEAMPAVAATVYNNPGLAWGESFDAMPRGAGLDHHSMDHHSKRIDTTHAPKITTHGRIMRHPRDEYHAPRPAQREPETVSGETRSTETRESGKRQKADAVAMIFKLEDECYMRLKYHSQKTGNTSQELIRKAIEKYLDDSGVHTGAWEVKPR